MEIIKSKSRWRYYRPAELTVWMSIAKPISEDRRTLIKVEFNERLARRIFYRDRTEEGDT